MAKFDMDETIKSQTIDRLKELVVERAQSLRLQSMTFREMYGGLVIELEENNPKSRVGGIYAYKDYVSLELAKGITFDDPNGVLEGTGKFRRHVKLHSLSDIEDKNCQMFVDQAVQSN